MTWFQPLNMMVQSPFIIHIIFGSWFNFFSISLHFMEH